MGLKLKECPQCGGDVGDFWVAGRKLQRSCRDCNWREKPRTPERKAIRATKFVCANHHSGFCYEIFDKYGHTAEYSRSYGSRAAAIKEMERDLKVFNTEGAPYTAVLWPSTVKVVGEKFTLKSLRKAQRNERNIHKSHKPH